MTYHTLPHQQRSQRFLIILLWGYLMLFRCLADSSRLPPSLGRPPSGISSQGQGRRASPCCHGVLQAHPTACNSVLSYLCLLVQGGEQPPVIAPLHRKRLLSPNIHCGNTAPHTTNLSCVCCALRVKGLQERAQKGMSGQVIYRKLLND